MAGNPYLWSTTALTNESSDPAVNWAEGQLPGTVNASGRGMMAGVAGFIKDSNGTVSTGGSSNAYTLTSNVAHAALSSGIIIGFKASFTNTAAATLSLNGLTAKALRVVSGAGDSALAANQIMINGHYIARYDSAANSAAGAWVVLNPSAPGLVKAGSSTRDLSTASGSQAITGVGFMPRLLFLNGNVIGLATLSIGFTDGTSYGTVYDNTLGNYGYFSDVIIGAVVSGGNLQVATVASFDSDGFTLAWVKAGSPTGTFSFSYLAIR